MDVFLRKPQDADELKRRIRQARDAKQRDRLRAVELAIAGQTTPSITKMLGRSRGFVQRWCYAVLSATTFWSFLREFSPPNTLPTRNSCALGACSVAPLRLCCDTGSFQGARTWMSFFARPRTLMT